MGNVRIPLEPDGCYHIYNHAVGKDDVFRSDENYNFFLRKFTSRVLPFADVLAYCLMPNHFHFVLRIKSYNKLEVLWQEIIRKKISSAAVNGRKIANQNVLMDGIIINEFAPARAGFNSYAQSYNKQYSRHGSLLKESFQRKIVADSEYLIKLICYVHNNPVNDGFASKPENWKYSSYKATLSNAKTQMLRDEVLEMFGSKENFIFMHQKYIGSDLDT